MTPEYAEIRWTPVQLADALKIPRDAGIQKVLVWWDDVSGFYILQAKVVR